MAEASLAILTYQEFSVMPRLLTVASLSSTIFNFMDCVEIVLDGQSTIHLAHVDSDYSNISRRATV